MKTRSSLSIRGDSLFQFIWIISLSSRCIDFIKRGLEGGYKKLSLLPIVFVMFIATAMGQTQAFFDNFNRAALNIGASTTYSVIVSTGDGGAAITSDSCLELTNDFSADTNANGIVYVAGLTQSFSNGYNQMLHADTGALEWTFNFRYSRSSNPPACLRVVMERQSF